MKSSKEEKRYRIKEIFYSIQGEGYHTGKPAIFIRFSGCNLWTGKEKDRDKAICKFCDTDFVGTDGKNGGIYTADELCSKVQTAFGTDCGFIVLTGGEPLLQLDKNLIDKLHKKDYFVALETNGTQGLTLDIDWVTVSPKMGSKLMLTSGDELKIVFPQQTLDPKTYEHMNFKHFFLQPKEEKTPNTNTVKTLEYCMRNPKWRLSIQLHKILGIE